MNTTIIVIAILLLLLALLLWYYYYGTKININDVIEAQNLAAYYSSKAREMYSMLG